MGPYAGGPACVGAPTRHVHCRCAGSIGCRNAIVDAQDNPIPMLMIRRHLFSPDTPPAATSLIAGASELRTHRSRIHASLFIGGRTAPTTFAPYPTPPTPPTPAADTENRQGGKECGRSGKSGGEACP